LYNHCFIANRAQRLIQQCVADTRLQLNIKKYCSAEQISEDSGTNVVLPSSPRLPRSAASSPTHANGVIQSVGYGNRLPPQSGVIHARPASSPTGLRIRRTASNELDCNLGMSPVHALFRHLKEDRQGERQPLGRLDQYLGVPSRVSNNVPMSVVSPYKRVASPFKRIASPFKINDLSPGSSPMGSPSRHSPIDTPSRQSPLCTPSRREKGVV